MDEHKQNEWVVIDQDLDDEEWDIEDEMENHETKEHWSLRREFLLNNKGRLPKLRLLCLSQVFANMEFLGCKYPKKTMELVAELSKGIADTYRDNKKSKLQPTFMNASTAAEKKRGKYERKNPQSQLFCTPNQESLGTSISSEFEVIPYCYKNENDEPKVEKPEDVQTAQHPQLQNLVIVENLDVSESKAQILHKSLNMCHMKYSFTIDLSETFYPIYKCTFKLGDFVIERYGNDKDALKQMTANVVLEKLKSFCFTLEIISSPKMLNSEQRVKVEDMENTEASEKNTEEHETSSFNSVGKKLMLLMGWSGGGLGKNTQGIREPVKGEEKIGRKGLGFGAENKDRSLIDLVKKYLKEKIVAGSQNEVIFSSDFTVEERKEIHMAAFNLGLKSKSYGKGNDRIVVVSRRISLPNLVQEILKLGNNSKYRVIEPSNSTKISTS